MTKHLSIDQAEAWTLGTLTPEETAAAEAHVEGCDACARLLAREAKLELELVEVAQRVPAPRWRRRRALGAAVAVAALAAGAVAVVSLQQASLRLSPQPTVVRCVDPASREACVSRAHFDGLLTVGPGEEPVVPRYELVPPGGTP